CRLQRPVADGTRVERGGFGAIAVGGGTFISASASADSCHRASRSTPHARLTFSNYSLNLNHKSPAAGVRRKDHSAQDHVEIRQPWSITLRQRQRTARDAFLHTFFISCMLIPIIRALV